MREEPGNIIMNVDAGPDARKKFKEEIHFALEVLGTHAEQKAKQWPGEEVMDPCEQRRCGFIPFCWE